MAAWISFYVHVDEVADVGEAAYFRHTSVARINSVHHFIHCIFQHYHCFFCSLFESINRRKEFGMAKKSSSTQQGLMNSELVSQKIL